MIVFNVETVERREAVFRDLPRAERVDGLIIVSLSPHASELERIQRSGLPAVLVDAHHRALPRVVADDVLGGRIAAEHLHRPGPSAHRVHRRHPADAAGLHVEPPATHRRPTGDGRRRTGAPDRTSSRIGDHSRASSRGADRADARAADCRRPASCAPATPRRPAPSRPPPRSGLRVPDDLSVTGYDDLELADHLGLTTIRQPLFESGVRAVAATADRDRRGADDPAAGGPGHRARHPPLDGVRPDGRAADGPTDRRL